jgi:aminopeptidase N
VRSFYEAEVESYVAEEGRREPVGRPAPSYDDTQYRVFVYSAGALFYNHLADEYGSDAVIQFLHTYYDRFRYDQVNNAELEQLVEETFGIDAGDFFEDWVYEGGDS